MESYLPAHKKLDVWQRALALAEATYSVTKAFPSEERYGLTAQMRRAAVSVLSNISEGAARRTTPEYVHFLHVARGSLSELDAQLELAIRLGFVQSDCTLSADLVRVAQMLAALITSMGRAP
jgi:four helix bundle protein